MSLLPSQSDEDTFFELLGGPITFSGDLIGINCIKIHTTSQHYNPRLGSRQAEYTSTHFLQMHWLMEWHTLKVNMRQLLKDLSDKGLLWVHWKTSYILKCHLTICSTREKILPPNSMLWLVSSFAIWKLVMTFANNFDPHDAPQNVGPHLWSKLFDTHMYE